MPRSQTLEILHFVPRARYNSTKVAIGYISGTKSTELDFHGHLFDVNYCREKQLERLCPRGPQCTNECPIGYKPDELGIGDSPFLTSLEFRL